MQSRLACLGRPNGVGYHDVPKQVMDCVVFIAYLGKAHSILRKQSTYLHKEQHPVIKIDRTERRLLRRVVGHFLR